MIMLDGSEVGLAMQETFSYTWRDVILYNLSVGADQKDLEYVYEKGLRPVPTFGVIPCTATFGTQPYHAQPVMPTSQIEGLRNEGTLHMDHKLEIFKPIPTEGSLNVEKVLTNIYDRGKEKGAKLVVQVTAKDASGELLFRNTMGYLNRWAGGFGGMSPPRTSSQIPGRKADISIHGLFPANSALLYRLTGDTFPIHADPEAARAIGLERPIIHGLCSLGYACRLLVEQLFPGEPQRMDSIETRFSSIAVPEESFILKLWLTGEGAAAFQMISEKSGKAILDQGRIHWK